jgi:protein phosphatase
MHVTDSTRPAPELSPGDASGPSPDAVAPTAPPCPQCQAPRPADAGFCGDCGYIFAGGEVAGPTALTLPSGPVAGRYRASELIGERAGVARFRGEDVGGAGDPLPVIVVRQAIPPEPPAPEKPAPDLDSQLDFELPTEADQATDDLRSPAPSVRWPGVGWEQSVLLRAAHLSLPRLIDSFVEDGFSYLIEEVPAGTPLWEAWDRDGITNRERFTWLVQLAEALERLHFAGAILEGLRPEMVVISPNGFAILADLSDILPLPFTAEVPLKGGFATAPELLLNPEGVDERADLYAFGALVYALLFGRELSDLDFTMTGMPRPILERVPDANPFLARLLAKTFVREPELRFPTDDGAKIDGSGFRELVAALEACRRNLDRVKLDVAAWSTVGMVRGGNEDGVYVHYMCEGRLDDSDEAALILLADGMGGMESGEVAAAMALQTLRQHLFASPPFASVLPPTHVPDDRPAPAPVASAETPEPPVLEPVNPEPNPSPAADWSAPEPDGLAPAAAEPPAAGPPEIPPLPAGTESPDRTPDAHAERVAAALREANRRVFEAARGQPLARGMGCTAEVLVIDGGTAIVGHVGDSRVYRMRRNRLAQITRDHTIVGRLLELGQLTEAEAETHPRRSELHQAIGGRPDVYPDVYSVSLEPGDWLLVCSDGLTNQVEDGAIQAVLKEARSAERAARRLINLALSEWALDNVTVAVVRVS